MESIRTLFIIRTYSDWWLYPPIGGASLRNWQNINAMMSIGSVGIFCLVGEEVYTKNKDYIEKPPGIAKWHISLVKEPKFTRIEKLQQISKQIKSLLTRGHPFTHTSNYRASNILLDLKNVLDEFKPDCVIFSEAFVGIYLCDLKAYPVKLILDAHNAETELLRENFKTKRLQNIKQKIRNLIEIVKIEIIERELTRNVDQIWTCSKNDISLLQKLSSKLIKAHIIPNGVNSNHYTNVRLNQVELPYNLSKSIHTLIFPAVFSTAANSQAVTFLLDLVYPKIKEKYPDCQLLLVGRNPSQQMIESSDQDTSIIVTGGVEDMRPYFSVASIFVVPLFQGSGTRLKILEAFACCRPVVSTSKGAEGINAISGKHLLIGDTVEEIVSHICDLWSDNLLRERIVQNAFELFEKEYSWNAVEAKVKQAIEIL